jgi:hypothetical protein
VLVERYTAMAPHYDFQFGKNHFRANGWQGLVALAMTLTSFTAVVGILSMPAKPPVFLEFDLLKRLVGN